MSALGVPDSVVPVLSRLKDVPGLSLVVVALFFVLHDLLPSTVLGMPTSRETHLQIAFVLALAMAGVGYQLGNFWDACAFDPLYGIDPERKRRGRWLDGDSRHIFGLLPAGWDLDQARRRAVQVCLGPGSDGQGIYAAARMEAVKAKQWTAVEGVLVLSKLFRTFIWPVLGIAAAFAVQFVRGVVTTGEAGIQPLTCALAALAAAAGLFVAYVQFRVDHMVGLYQLLAARVTTS